jgi:hypothetical protein
MVSFEEMYLGKSDFIETKFIVSFYKIKNLSPMSTNNDKNEQICRWGKASWICVEVGVILSVILWYTWTEHPWVLPVERMTLPGS